MAGPRGAKPSRRDIERGYLDTKREAEITALRLALKAMVSEFRDYHYDRCPANWGGKCDCYAGLIIGRAKDTLGDDS